MFKELFVSLKQGYQTIDYPRTTPVLPARFRGLPVVDWMYADGGEGSAWGPVFDASPQAVAAAIPEAAATAKFLHGPHEGRVERSLVELSASQTWLSCRQPNYLHYD